MGNARFILALTASKIAIKGIDLVAKGRGTNLPGEIALKIDPLFVSHFANLNPEKTVFVTGTNGKSTTVNLLHHVLTSSGRRVVANLDGANMLSGVATALIKDSTSGGKIKSDYVVMETDERYLSLIRKQFPAKYLIVTNIQKDQTQRNGEPGVIAKKISSAMGDDLTAILNRDDPRTLALSEHAGEHVTYSVARNSKSYNKEEDFFSVTMPCPKCHNPIEFEAHNIENIGPFKCEHCGLGSDSADAMREYRVDGVDYEGNSFVIGESDYPFNFNTPYFLYCYIAVYAAAKELGLSDEEIKDGFAAFSDLRGRLAVKDVGGKSLNYIKMKQENPETIQSSVNLVAEDKNRKDFLIGFDEYLDYYPPFTNTLAFFDVDFRPVNKSGVASWTCMSKALGRVGALRLLYDGFDIAGMKISDASSEADVANAISESDAAKSYLVEEIPYWKKR